MVKLYANKMEEFDPTPDNDLTWWQRSHCSPGSMDSDDKCECGKSHHNCAINNTEFIHKIRKMAECQCSGFWCLNCGLFYPNDSCWETFGVNYQTASGISVIEKQGEIYCQCGQYLFPDEDGSGEENIYEPFEG